MGSPPHTTHSQPSSVDQPPVKPNPFRPSAVIATVFGAIGTGATIVGGGILLSFHKLTVDDEHTRRAAGITTVVVGAVMIPPTLIIGAYDAYRYFKWRQWMKAHSHQANGVVEMNQAPHAPPQPPATINTAATETTLSHNNEPHHDYADDDHHNHNHTHAQQQQPQYQGQGQHGGGMHMTTLPESNHAGNIQPVKHVQIVTVS